MSIEDEIQAMNELPPAPPEGGDPTVLEPEPAPEPAPASEPTPEPAPAAPEPAPAPTAEPLPVEPPAAEDLRDATIEGLRAEIARLAALSGAPAPVAPVEPVAPPPQAPVAPQAPAPQPSAPAVIEFVKSEEELNQVLDSVGNFNSFLTRFASDIAQNIRAQVVSEAKEATMVSIPALVGNLAEQAVNMRMAVKEFYSANSDLAPYASYVGSVANEIAAREPQLPLDQLFEKLGPEVRSRLHLKERVLSQALPGAGPEPTPSAEGPAFPPSSGGTRKPTGADVKLSKTEREILEMLEATGGQ